ncbi:rhodanese-like domain-containing protein [Cellulosimicrobium funkei]|uniref:rhodanese-like domain-containing protein n=1 Tax=Cellulosimicrobium TaxID=157920 RepID=UPI000A17A893|nr:MULTISPECIES: rhodanese-like domain-containing protein [unclassified Cellulosimicrobium]ARK03486.1 sulfurtransferase [Cellulosimicrobium sp. TH-20]
MTTTPPLRAATDAAAQVADGALLIDVRSAGGRAAHGEIPGATLADRDDLDALFGPADAPVISLDTPVVVVCGSPNGSGPVAEALARRGYTHVSHVDGGFPAWKEAGLPASDPVGAAPEPAPAGPAASPDPTAPARP